MERRTFISITSRYLFPTLIVVAIILIAIGIVLVRYANARELPTVIYGQTETVCPSKEGALGCIVYAENTIYIRSDLNEWGKRYVLYHELCHWLGEMDESICTQVATNLMISQ